MSVKDKLNNRANRRSFLTGGLAVAGAAVAGSNLLADTDSAQSGALTTGDVAILRFHAALEILDADFWIQYNELAGIQDNEVPGGSGNPAYTAALSKIDDDMPQYIHDNTDDEISHAQFLNAYLVSKGAPPVILDSFRVLPGSMATGSSGLPRLTNLMRLTLDTSWYTRYRSSGANPDLNPNFPFPQAVPGLSKGKFTAIPNGRRPAPAAHLQAIANTAAFHFATVEQGGSSLYPQHALRTTNVEALRILLSIGPTETSHFQTWHDTAGDVVAPLVDPTNGLTFPDLNAPPFGGELFQTSLIMPEPCPFLSTSLPKCSIIRPTATLMAASNALAFLTSMGLFSGQSSGFFELMGELAAQADAARRGMP